MKRKKSFFFDIDDEFERMRREINEMMRRMFEGLEEFEEEDFEKLTKPYVWGYSIKIGPDGKPEIKQFGNIPKISEEKVKLSEEREPFVDVIEEKKNLKIIAELPGVEKEDIDLTTTENGIEIKVDTPERKYYKKLKLPCEIKPETAKANYKNGVLEIVVERKEEKKEERKGFKVKVD
ncbi:MAG: archaeal heat shock protein Hsp20 [Candidatus Micrarchaeia archaeon]